MSSDELNTLIERIASATQTATDVEALRVALTDYNQDLRQLGKYNVNIGQGQDIHIGDRTYVSWNEEAIKTLIEVVQKQLPKPTGIPTNLPPSGAIHFVGREQELKMLHRQLQQNETAIFAIVGMGGTGKTELARQYVLTYKQMYLGGICWLQARAGNVGMQIVQFAQAYLQLCPPNGLDLLGQVKFCWRNWQPGAVLVVLDDLTNYQAIQPYLPPSDSRFKLLITTRLRLEDIMQPLILDTLNEISAFDLLQGWIGADKLVCNPLTREDSASKLCKRLGCLPLALQLVGRYIKKRKLTLDEMLHRLESKGLSHPSMHIDQKDRTFALNVERGVEAAFQLSWEDLDDSPKAQRLAHLLSLFALAPIPWNLVEGTMNEQDSEELEDARIALENLNLLQGEDPYQLHQLIREFFQTQLVHSQDADALKQRFCQTMVAVAKEVPEAPTREQILAIAPTMPHIAEAAITLKDWLSDDGLISPYISLQRFYQSQGAYTQVEFWAKQCLLLCLNRFSEKHLNVARSFNNLAVVYEVQGRYKEAELLFTKALNLYKNLLPKEDSEVAASLNNLAGVYRAQGRYQEAEPLYREALEMTKRLLGNEHPQVATILNNLALIYRSQSHYKKAELLYREALEMTKRLLGNEHLKVATSLSNLALVYEFREQYGEAELLYREALEMTRRLLGDENPALITGLNNLAYLYTYRSRAKEAKPLYQEALKIAEKTLGSNHPKTNKIRENLEQLRNRS